jgi:hypothetical protein
MHFRSGGRGGLGELPADLLQLLLHELPPQALEL